MIELKCRLITIDDSDDVLSWRNDVESRINSSNTNIISPIEHQNWFSEMFNNRSHLGFIGEINSEKIGVVFMKTHKENARISINLNPLYRGKKLAVSLLRSSMQEVQKLHPQIRQFIAEIKNTNTASIKVFVQNGFTLNSKQNGTSVYNFKLWE